MKSSFLTYTGSPSKGQRKRSAGHELCTERISEIILCQEGKGNCRAIEGPDLGSEMWRGRQGLRGGVI